MDTKTKKIGQRIAVKADRILGSRRTMATIVAICPITKVYLVRCDDDGENVEITYDGRLVHGYK